MYYANRNYSTHLAPAEVNPSLGSLGLLTARGAAYDQLKAQGLNVQAPSGGQSFASQAWSEIQNIEDSPAQETSAPPVPVQQVELKSPWLDLYYGLSLPTFIAVVYGARKNDHGWLASFGLAILANLVGSGVAVSPLGPASLAVPAAAGYYAYKGHKKSG